MLRQPHAPLDVEGRRPKAEKIRHFLALPTSGGRPLRLLEIGTGSGAIAHHFATDRRLDCEVEAVDVLDQRSIRDGYAFQLVEGVTLPFDDASFDAVISNHVIEHVGGETEQVMHLREMARVLRDGGRAYLATPNRWQLVEPHYHLAFLSWLPRGLRTPYLALWRKGAQYDCEPLRMGELEAMLRKAGLEYLNICIEGLRYVLTIERPKSRLARLAGRLPDGLLQRLRRVCPTHVYLLKRIPRMP